MTRQPDPSRITLKRVYDTASPKDGVRILVDRLWPRGLSRDAAAIDFWIKDVAPSAALRQWFGHRPERWVEFRKRYKSELARRPQALAEIQSLAKKGRITLLFAAHDEHHNNAVVLCELLRAKESPLRASKTKVTRTRGGR
ncbi:MAG TPA: DUF488 family protein [Burkholderiales bacterium]|nr:DUF488 family protein [Burkholderiales bacterium]